MELKVWKGRPVTKERRLPKEERTYDLLDELNIEYERVDHEPAMTMDACDDIINAFHTPICKNLFLCNAGKTDFYLLVMPGDKKFKTKIVSSQLGVSRLSFAPEEYLLDFLDITPGSVSIMGLMNDKDNRVKLLVDREILNDEYFACHPCINTSSIKLRISDVFGPFLEKIHHEAVYVDLEES